MSAPSRCPCGWGGGGLQLTPGWQVGAIGVGSCHGPWASARGKLPAPLLRLRGEALVFLLGPRPAFVSCFGGAFFLRTESGGGGSSASELRAAGVGPVTLCQSPGLRLSLGRILSRELDGPVGLCLPLAAGASPFCPACSCSAAKPVWGLRAVSVRLSPSVPSLRCPVERAVPWGVRRPLRDPTPC